MNKEKYISIVDLARILGVSRQAVQKQIDSEMKKHTGDEGGIKFKRIGRGFLYKIESLPEEMKKNIKSAQSEAAKKMKNIKPTKKNTKDLSFEKELWDAADRLRGNVDVSEYKHIVLGLLFLKYVSDAYYHRRQEIERRVGDKNDKDYYIPDVDLRNTVIEDRDQYKSEGVFYIPEKARWENLSKYATSSEIGRYIDEAMDAIEGENQKQLKGVLPKIYTRISLEPYILGELVNIFSKIKFDHDLDKEKDLLGRVYEYFLGQFASAEGKRGGEFYTPKSLVRLLVEVLSPYENTRVFDPACGSGGMFVQSSQFLKMYNKDQSKISFYGQESNRTTWRLCRMNLAIRGIFGDIQLGSSYYDDKFSDLRADFVLANPPFNAEWEPNRLSDKDPRLKYGVPSSGNANFMWIQHFIHHLAPGGMAGFVMANGALAVGGKDGKIREKIIEDDLVDVIIACPAKMFYSVALPVSLCFFTKNKKNGRFRNRTGETLFIDAREYTEPISKKQVIFTDEHIQKIAGTVRAWRGEEGTEKYEDVAGFCKAVKKDEIVKNGYVLTPGRYVGITEEEDDGIPFEEKMNKLTDELKEHFKEGKRLEEEIEENLKKFKL
jgi:type I restriction enzyme M protein